MLFASFRRPVWAFWELSIWLRRVIIIALVVTLSETVCVRAPGPWAER